MPQIYVGNVHFEANEQDLESLFKQCGDISSVNLIKDRNTGRPKGHAFVHFAKSSQVDAAVKLDGMRLKGRYLKIDVTRRKPSKVIPKIFVCNLSFEANEQDLRNLFKNFGDIILVNLVKDRDTGCSKGSAFVGFASSAQTEAALKLDGEQFKGRPLKVNLAREKSFGSSDDRKKRESSVSYR